MRRDQPFAMTVVKALPLSSLHPPFSLNAMSWSTIPVNVDDGFPRDTVPEMWAKTTAALEEVLRNIPAASEPVETIQVWMKAYEQALGIGSVGEDATSRGLNDPVYPLSLRLAISNALPTIKKFRLTISHPGTTELALTAPSEVRTGHIPPKRCVGQNEEPSAVATSSKHDEGKEMSHHGDNKIPRSQVDKHTRKDGSGRNEGNPDSADVSCERKCESASKVERKRKGPAAPPSLSLTTKRPKPTPPLASSSLPQSSKLTLRLKRRSTSRMVSQGNVPVKRKK
ncbi:hypothetical protein EV401DRAFT_2180421 [Pisolithus croceorrhizus]|nr:hypothetical protein EV401DRAFT_2180421 [Pisolithus croceorrhizus]